MIVRQIVAAHRGSITYQSKQGRGTTFNITLPVDRPAEGNGHDRSPRANHLPAPFFLRPPQGTGYKNR